MIGWIRRLWESRSHPILSSVEAYARWAAAYPPHAHNPFMEAEQEAMLSVLPDLQGRVVLDLGCGTGRYTRLALERGAQFAVGLDNSMEMLQRNWLSAVGDQRPAKDDQPARLLALSTMDAIPLASSSVEVVLCGLAVGHLPTLTRAFGEISRVLKPDGYALVSDFHPFMALSGRQRTFSAPDGRTYAVEHYPHLYADYQRASRDSRLRIEHVVEPSLAGRRFPAAIVLRLRKAAG